MARDEELFLHLGQTTINLHDVVVGAFVYLWICTQDKVKNVHFQLERVVPSTDPITRSSYEKYLRSY
jgi:hypothetical protein